MKPAEEIWYTKSPDMVLIGELELHLPEEARWKDRAVEIVFDFSHTEIQVRAYDKSSQMEVKAVLDFLSATRQGAGSVPSSARDTDRTENR